jgi:hypothetical protein
VVNYFTARYGYFSARWSYFTARWSLERVIMCNVTARQSRKNGHVKKKRGRQYFGVDILYLGRPQRLSLAR